MDDARVLIRVWVWTLLLAGCVATGPPPEVEAEQERVGMYVYMADAATFTDCRTRERYPVLLEGDHLAVERAYLAARTGPGAYGQLTVRGRLVEHAPEAGLTPRLHLLIDEFIGFRAVETCAPFAQSTASLTNTYWRPVELDGAPVLVAAEAREPHVVFEADRVRGYSGCNQFTAGYTHADGQLSIGPIAGTRRMCAPPEDAELEPRLYAALEAAATLEVIAETLTLRDAAGVALMRCESRYLD